MFNFLKNINQPEQKDNPRNINVGRIGEDVAVRWLLSKNYYIIDRNWRTYWGEIDIIAKKDDKTFFIEVKTSAKETLTDLEFSNWRPEERVDEHKIKKLYRVVEIYANKNKVRKWKMLAMSVLLGLKDKKAKIKTFDF